MTIEDIILNNSPVGLAKLIGPATKAVDKPDSGITIQNKAAYFVIRDCAILARDYLPLHIYSITANPLTFFKGKFSKVLIEEFVTRAMENTNAFNLLKLIISDINYSKPRDVVNDPSDIKYNLSTDSNIYGDYGLEETPKPQSGLIDIKDKQAIIKAMLETFGTV